MPILKGSQSRKPAIMLYLAGQRLKDATEKEISESNCTLKRKNKSLHPAILIVFNVLLFPIKLAPALKLFFEDLFFPVLAIISRTVTVNNILPTLPEPS